MLHDLTTNDVFWGKIVGITGTGERETHSISVADTDNLCRREFRCLPHRVATTRPLLQLRGATKTITAAHQEHLSWLADVDERYPRRPEAGVVGGIAAETISAVTAG
jgi:signal recognition particle subunit SEC65